MATHERSPAGDGRPEPATASGGEDDTARLTRDGGIAGAQVVTADGGDGLDRDVIARVAAELRAARSVLFITGAGLSADSGLPTYRGIGGLYEERHTEEDIPIEVALSGPMLTQRPDIAWRHIYSIEAACRGAAPNRAHELIAALEQRLERVWVLTQNVDGFHRAAGTQNLIEIHGDIHRLRCTVCAYRERVADYSGLEIPPRCRDCGAVIRPEVVLFGEMLPPRAVQTLRAALSEGFDLIFSVGTTSMFPYIAGPVIHASRSGRVTVEINPGDTAVSSLVRYRIRASAKLAFEAIWAELGADTGHEAHSD
ncbi:MAG: NAD-dependent deacylase [Haliangiales bacterium]